jgi:hypothetical protein
VRLKIKQNKKHNNTISQGGFEVPNQNRASTKGKNGMSHHASLGN